MGVKNKRKIKKEYIPVIIAVVLFIGLIAALIAVILYKPKENEVEIDPNQHVQEEIALDNSNSTCKKETLDELYKLANKVTVDTKMLEEKSKPDNEDYPMITYYVPEITFNNVDSKLMLNITRNTDDLNQNLNPKDGKIVYKADYSMGLTTYMIEIKSSGECKGETVRKFSLVVPLFNEYSEYIICEQIPKFKYCQKFMLEEQPSLQEFIKLCEKYVKENNITTKNYLEMAKTSGEE